jgi:hypothetical protein
MPLQVPEPPREGVDVMRTTIRAMADQRLFRTPALRSARADDIEITEPHEIYVLGLSDLRENAGLGAARPVGWRYLVRGGDQIVAAAESASGTGESAHVFSQVNEGPFVASTVEALSALRAEPLLEEHTYTQQMLHIPALHAMALWLRHNGDDDLLVPLAPFPLDVPTGQAVPAAELLDRLSALAARVSDEPADGTKGS